MQNKDALQIFLDSQPALSGLDDFCRRAPQLFYAQLTGGNVNTFSPHVLRYPSRGARGDDARSVVYCGHQLKFSPEEDLFGQEMVRGVLTVVETLDEAPLQHPNRKLLREYLNAPSSVPSCVHIPTSVKFANAYTLSGQQIRIFAPLLDKSDKVAGDVKRYWSSFYRNVGRPLVSVLWRF